MKPVELVLIMRDKTRQALLDAGQNVDGLSKDYDELIRFIRASEAQMEQSGQAAKRTATDYGSLQPAFAKIGEAAVAGGTKIDSAYKKAFEEITKYGIGSKDELIKAIEQQKQAVAKLQEQYNNANAAFYNVKQPTNLDATYIEQRQKAIKLLGESKVELSQEKAMLETLEKAYQKVTEALEKSNNERKPEKVATYRTQIMNLTNEMKRMRESGQKDSDEYRKLEEELKRVGIAYNEATKQRKLLTGGGNADIAGIISGISGIAGAFSAAQGVAALFVGSNERLAAIQTKLQAVMAITIGLQQVSSTLHATSAFRIKTVEQVTKLWTHAQGILNTQLGVSVGLSKALMVGGIGLLIAGGIALVSVIKNWNKEQRELNEMKLEVIKNTQNEITKVKSYDAVLKNSTNSLTSRNEALKNLREIMPSYNAMLDKEGKLIEDNTGALNKYIEKIKAAAMAKLASDKLAAAQTDLDEFESGLSKSDKMAFMKRASGQLTPQEEFVYKTMFAIHKTKKDEVKKYEDLLNQYLPKQLEDDAPIKGTKAWWEKELKRLGDELGRMTDKEVGSERWNKIKAEQESASHILEKWNKVKSTTQVESEAEKAKRKAQAQEDANTKISNTEAKAALERLQIDNNLQQKLLDSEKDGFDKRLEQIRLDYNKEVLAAAKHAQELVEKRQEAERLQWEKEGKKGVFTPETKNAEQLPPEQQNEIKLQLEAANKVREAANKKLTDDLIKQYQTYSDRRLEIEKQFKSDLVVLQAQNTDGSLNATIAELEKQRKQQLREINEQESAELVKTTDLFVRLFTDAATQSVDQVKRVIDETRLLYDYLASTRPEDITANFGFTAEQLRSFQANAERMKAILDGLNSKKKELGNRSPIDAFARSMGEALTMLKKGGNDNVKLGVEKIGAAAKEFLPYVKQFGEDLGAIFGTDIWNLVSGATEALGAVMNVAEGFAKGGVIGGIASVVGEAAKLFTKAAEAEKRHQESLKAIMNAKIDEQRKYNLLLLEQRLLLKEATTIFGEKEITKAANAIKVYGDAVSQFKKELQGTTPGKSLFGMMSGSYQKQLDAYNKGIGALSQITIKTGHEKTGLFGLGKGKDIYNSILNIYGKDKLLNPDGTLNINFAKTILDTQTLSDENRKLLQSLIDLQEEANKAQEALRDYLKQTFGALGSDLMDSIAASIQDKGVSAWEKFGDAGAKVIENLGKQLAYELFFANKFAKLQKDLEAVYGATDDPEEIARRQMELVGKFYETIGSDMEAAQAFMENWKKEAEKYNFNLWQSEGASQTGKAGAFTTMTQDQAGKLEGLFTSLQMHAASIDNLVTNISDAMYQAQDSLMRIADNTEYCKFLEDISEDIKRMIRDGLKIK